MCEPTTLALIGAGIGAVGSLAEGASARQQAQFQEQIARNNAIIAERKADDAIARGKQERRAKQLETTRLIGEARASAAGSGVAVGTGSVLNVTSDIAQFGKLDELTIKNNALREALGFRSQAEQFRTEAEGFERAGDAAALQGVIGAGTSLLSGASAVDSKWFNFGGSGGGGFGGTASSPYFSSAGSQVFG